MTLRTGPTWLAAGLALLVGGCVVAAVGAGAGGGIYFSERGAESVVPAGIERALAATRRAFAQLGVRETGSKIEDEGREREVSGRAGRRDVDVTVKLKAERPGYTRVEVVARKSAVTWDKDFARAVLEKIVAFSR